MESFSEKLLYKRCFDDQCQHHSNLFQIEKSTSNQTFFKPKFGKLKSLSIRMNINKFGIWSFIIGNKFDLADSDGEVEINGIEKYASLINSCKYCETSAKTGEGIQD
jgi:hypothetical protein